MNIESLEQDAANGLLDAQEFLVWRRLQTLNWLLNLNRELDRHIDNGLAAA